MTNAWIQGVLTLGTMVLAWALGLWLWGSHPALVLLGLMAPVLVTFVLIAQQFIIFWYVTQNDSAERESVATHVKAWWGEANAALKVFHWWQPFHRTNIPDGLDATSIASGQRGVVLVHGFFCNRAFWQHWMRRLQAQHRPYIAVDLEPAFGTIDAYTATLERAVRQMRQATGLSPVIVGHSMGGLAIRAWLATQTTQADGQSAVQRAITLGSPHHGTWLAQFSHTTNGLEMRQESRWLNALASMEKVLPFVEFVCFYSNCDNIVFPISSAKLAGADNRLIRGLGHVDMVHDPLVMDACWELMQ